MLDFTKLWDKQYLFGPNPLSLSRSDYIFFGLALIFLVAAIFFKLLVLRKASSDPKRYLFSRFFHSFLTTSLFVFVWVGARFENIPWLSTHFLVLTLFLIWFVWMGFIVKYLLKDYRKQKQLWDEETLKQKYFVKKWDSLEKFLREE